MYIDIICARIQVLKYLSTYYIIIYDNMYVCVIIRGIYIVSGGKKSITRSKCVRRGCSLLKYYSIRAITAYIKMHVMYYT